MKSFKYKSFSLIPGSDCPMCGKKRSLHLDAVKTSLYCDYADCNFVVKQSEPTSSTICANANCPNYDESAEKMMQWCCKACEPSIVDPLPRQVTPWFTSTKTNWSDEVGTLLDKSICSYTNVGGMFCTNPPANGYTVCEEHLALLAAELRDLSDGPGQSCIGLVPIKDFSIQETVIRSWLESLANDKLADPIHRAAAQQLYSYMYVDPIEAAEVATDKVAYDWIPDIGVPIHPEVFQKFKDAHTVKRVEPPTQEMRQSTGMVHIVCPCCRKEYSASIQVSVPIESSSRTPGPQIKGGASSQPTEDGDGSRPKIVL